MYALLLALAVPAARAAPSIVEAVTGSPVHTRFVEVITDTKYDAIYDAVNGATPEASLTVFAPTNDAFAAAEAALGFDFTNTTDPDQIAAVLATLNYHVVSGSVERATLISEYNTATLPGEQIIVKDPPTTVEGKVPVGVDAGDIDCTNGHVYITDGVIQIPSTVADIAGNEPSVALLMQILALPAYSAVLDIVATATPANAVTVFAPTDAAFAAAGIDIDFASDPANVALVTDVLRYHLSQKNVFSGILTVGDKITVGTVQGAGVVVERLSDRIDIGGATATATDVLASNGVIHIIDTVLVIPNGILDIIKGSADKTRMVEILTSGKYDAILEAAENATPQDPLSVFAPNNAAFAAAETLLGFDFATTTDPAEIALVTEVLKYHVYAGFVNGTNFVNNYNTSSIGDYVVFAKNNTVNVILNGDQSINNVTEITVIDSTEGDNGWVHAASSVIIVPPTVADIATKTAAVSTLAGILSLPNYADILSVVTGATAAAPITVFAPTDAAFTAAGIDVDFANQTQNEELVKNTLKYHVVAQNIFAGGLPEGSQVNVPTLYNNNRVTVAKEIGGAVKVGPKAAVPAGLGDVLAANGVIHAIDTVLAIPNSIVNITSNSPDHTRFIEVITDTKYKAIYDAADAATEESPLTVFAPTNAAFAAAEAALGFDFTNTTDPDQIAAVLAALQYHVMTGSLDAATLLDNYNTATLVGSQAIVENGTPPTIKGNITVDISDNIQATNGYVHVTASVILIPDNIATIAGRTSVISTLLAVLNLPEYAEILSIVAEATAAEPLTVFAPSDQAFTDAGIDIDYVTNPANVDAVKDILKYHLAGANVFAGALSEPGSATIPTKFESRRVLVEKAVGGGVTVGGSPVSVGDVLASNGVVHVLDKVLTIPDSILAIVTASPVHTRFVEVLSAPNYTAIYKAAEEATAESPLTIFAPTNDAFTAAEAELGFDFVETTDPDQIAAVLAVLGFHVMTGTQSIENLVATYNNPTLNGEQALITQSGTTYTVKGQNSATVTAEDLDANNGMIHYVDTVLLVPSTIAAIAGSTDDVSLLMEILALDNYADQLALVAAATPADPLTVFAPTNQAFADAGIDKAYAEDAANVDAVKDILSYHLVTLNVFAGNLVDGQRAEFTTAQGKKLVVFKEGGVVYVSDTQRAEANPFDVLASNGVVHVINKVLDPNNAPAPDDGLSPAATAAIVIGIILGIILVVGVIGGAYFYKNKNKHTVQLESETERLTQSGP